MDLSKNISAKHGPNDRTYAAGFMDQKVTLYASSLAEAKQRAVEYFKPKKRNAGLLWVQLADKPISTASLG